MPIVPYQGVDPRLGGGVFVAPGAWVIGDVELGQDVSVWFGAVVRGDVNSIRIGRGSNIQDSAVVHVTHEKHPLDIGERVVVGHATVVHGCTIGSGSLIGIGARVLDGAVIEEGAQVGAGAVVAPGSRVPSGTLVLGIPAKPFRKLRPDELEEIDAIAGRYVELKEKYRGERWLSAPDAPQCGDDADA